MNIIFIPAFMLGITLLSCTGYIEITEQTDYDIYKNKIKSDVLAIKTFDEFIVFSEKKPGRMTDECVEGIRQVILEDFGADSLALTYKKNDNQISYAYKHGNLYDVIDHNNKNVVFIPERQICIHYNEIEKMYLKVFRPGKTALFIEGLTGSFIAASSKMVTNVTFDMGIGK